MRLVTIGIPVKNEAENIPHLIQAINGVQKELSKSGLSLEVIVNNNASTDNSLKLLEDWATTQKNIRIFNFDHGVSFQESILNLMRNAKGDALVIYQSDLQDPFQLINVFVKKWLDSQGPVLGVIKKRHEKIVTKAVRKVFYWVLKATSDKELVVGFQDFYLLPRYAYVELGKLSPEGLFLRGHIATRFSNLSKIEYIRNDRTRGITKFNFPQKYELALDGILLFGTRIIRIVAIFSMALFFTGVLVATGLLVSYFLGFRSEIKGWTSLSVSIALLISMFGIISSLILEYLVRIYRQLIFGNISNSPNEIKTR